MWVDTHQRSLPERYCLMHHITVNNTVRVNSTVLNSTLINGTMVNETLTVVVNKTIVDKRIPNCKPYNALYNNATTYQQAYYAGLKSCVSYAIAKGFTNVITFNPRLDQFNGSLWRAWLPFDPLASYGGHTYHDTMLKPCAAIAKELAGKAKMWRLGLGGEHQHTITAFPENYIQAMGQLRQVAPGEQCTGWASVCCFKH